MAEVSTAELLERLKYSGKAAVSTLEPRDCKALHDYVVELQRERDELTKRLAWAEAEGFERGKLWERKQAQAAARAREDAVDVVVASVEVVPVAEDRTKPPPGYEVRYWSYRKGAPWAWGQAVLRNWQGWSISEAQAVRAAWADHDARAKR